MALVGILLFVAALLFSVMVHEFGHYIFAKKFGMKVTEFFLGFGKRIWSTQRGETEFGIKAIPAGGYCRIEGMTTNDQMPEGEEGRAFVIASHIICSHTSVKRQTSQNCSLCCRVMTFDICSWICFSIAKCLRLF